MATRQYQAITCRQSAVPPMHSHVLAQTTRLWLPLALFDLRAAAQLLDLGSASDAGCALDRSQRIVAVVARQWRILGDALGPADDEIYVFVDEQSNKFEAATAELDSRVDKHNLAAALRRWRACLHRFRRILDSSRLQRDLESAQ